MADLKAIAEELVNLTVKEVNELATILKDEYGIEPAAAAVAVAAAPAAAGAAAEEEKTEFDVVLKSAGAAKLQDTCWQLHGRFHCSLNFQLHWFHTRQWCQRDSYHKVNRASGYIQE